MQIDIQGVQKIGQSLNNSLGKTEMEKMYRQKFLSSYTFDWFPFNMTSRLFQDQAKLLFFYFQKCIIICTQPPTL